MRTRSLPRTPTILVTGGAGAVGRDVVAELHRREPSAEIILLLRAASPLELHRRMADLRHACRPARLTALRGDVTLPDLGLAAAVRDGVAARVTHVIHGAACIDLAQTDESAQRVNVGGTREVLRFARRCPRLRRLAHVSTAYVAGDRSGVIREDELDAGQSFRNAYERSKRDAERCIRAAARELPVLVFRPGIVVGRDSALDRPLRAILGGRLRVTEEHARTRLDVVPVDRVARAIVELTLGEARPGTTYHVTGGRAGAVTIRDLVAAAGGRLVTQPDAAPRDPSGFDVFLRYLIGDGDFDRANLRRDLGEDRIAPAPRERLAAAIVAHALAGRPAAVRMGARSGNPRSRIDTPADSRPAPSAVDRFGL
ncbi:MAG TPA: SDR family oxidoreductase [bacterium]|nr:SDR family oxidoreductase [bacterium]